MVTREQFRIDCLRQLAENGILPSEVGQLIRECGLEKSAQLRGGRGPAAAAAQFGIALMAALAMIGSNAGGVTGRALGQAVVPSNEHNLKLQAKEDLAERYRDATQQVLRQNDRAGRLVDRRADEARMSHFNR